MHPNVFHAIRHKLNIKPTHLCLQLIPSWCCGISNTNFWFPFCNHIPLSSPCNVHFFNCINVKLNRLSPFFTSATLLNLTFPTVSPFFVHIVKVSFPTWVLVTSCLFPIVIDVDEISRQKIESELLVVTPPRGGLVDRGQLLSTNIWYYSHSHQFGSPIPQLWSQWPHHHQLWPQWVHNFATPLK